jgi:hypothetical protein
MFALVLGILMKEMHVDVLSSTSIQDLTCACLVMLLVINVQVQKVQIVLVVLMHILI